MQIASRTTSIAHAPRTPAALAPDEVRLTPGGADGIVERGSDALRPPSTPGSAAWVRYGRYLLDFAGATAVSQRTSEPNIVRISFETPELAALARNAVADVVDGATMVMQSVAGDLPPKPAGSGPWQWWDRPLNIYRAISSIRGVVNVDHGTAGATVWADSAAYREVLKPLIRTQLHEGSWLGWYVWPHPPGGSRP